MTKEAILADSEKGACMLRLVGGDINKVNGITAFNAMREGYNAGAHI